VIRTPERSRSRIEGQIPFPVPEWPGLPNLTQAPQRGHEELNRRGTFTGT